MRGKSQTFGAIGHKARFIQKLPANVLFGIVAKKIEQKEKLREAHYLFYDLDDF